MHFLKPVAKLARESKNDQNQFATAAPDGARESALAAVGGNGRLAPTPVGSAEAVRRRKPSEATCRVAAGPRRDGRRNPFREPNVFSPCGFRPTRQRLDCARVYRRSGPASTLTLQPFSPPTHENYETNPISKRHIHLKNNAFRKFCAVFVGKTNPNLPGYSKGMGQLVPIRAGWHSDPPAGTEPAILFPKWTLGGTGFQPVVSGVPPEPWRAHSALRVQQSALSSGLPRRSPAEAGALAKEGLRTPHSPIQANPT